MKALIDAALDVRQRAYAPYSKYKVGASILDESGNILVGCNVENVSYPVGMCAERAAIARMVSDGSTRIAAIAVATRDGGTPCGMCLQAIAEFADPDGATPVYLVAESGAVTTYSLAQLLPHGFRSDDVAS